MADSWGRWFLADLKRNWHRLLIAAVVGAVAFIVVSETGRALLGKPSIFGLVGIGDYG